MLSSNSSGLKVLTQREARVVAAVAETMFPTDGPMETTVDDVDVVAYVDDLLNSLQLKERIGSRLFSATIW